MLKNEGGRLLWSDANSKAIANGKRLPTLEEARLELAWIFGSKNDDGQPEYDPDMAKKLGAKAWDAVNDQDMNKYGDFQT